MLWYIANSRKLEAGVGESLRDQQQVVDEWQSYQPDGQGLRFGYWSKQFMMNNEKIISKNLEMHAKLRATYAALAVAQYRLQHGGQLPVSLDDLVPAFLEAVPVEPQSDKPFELIVTADGYGIGRGAPVFKVKLIDRK